MRKARDLPIVYYVHLPREKNYVDHSRKHHRGHIADSETKKERFTPSVGLDPPETQKSKLRQPDQKQPLLNSFVSH